MKILLVQPSPFEPGRLGLENVVWMSEPVALTSIAALVPEHDVQLLDMRLEEDLELNRVLIEFQPDLVGTTSMTTDCYQAKAILQIAKSTLGDQCFTIVGGHHPTLAPEDFESDCVDALCLGEGEDTFKELIDHLSKGGSSQDLHHIAGLRFKNSQGGYTTTEKRTQSKDIASFPEPARHLIKESYKKEYFFTIAGPMASMSTSRGCSFDCNFCAIWEFYERRTRYMDAVTICDRLEKMSEKFVFFLDDNFLTNRQRLEALCDEIEKRGIKKYFGTQGRTDFIADNPEVMKRLRNAGLVMVLSGFESNDADSLKALRKKNTMEKNKQAARIMRQLGMISTGIFMVRPEFEEADFDVLYETINELQIAIPLVTVLTPLPGTQLYKKKSDQLLTKDARLFDILHAVTETKLLREVFYKKYAQWYGATDPGGRRGIWASIWRRPKLYLTFIPGIIRHLARLKNFRPITRNYQSHIRDEIGIIKDRPRSQPPAYPQVETTLDEVKKDPEPEPEMVGSN